MCLLLLLQTRTSVDLEEDDVSIEHNVLLSLLLAKAGSLDGGFALVCGKVGVRHHLGTHEAISEIGVDHASSIGSECSFLQHQRPASNQDRHAGRHEMIVRHV
jgi:hypothetical protein